MPHNVILFGEAGCGKSSLVNMIVRKDVARVSDSASGCTFQNEAYETTIGNTPFVIYDTPGLNEGEECRVPHWKAIQGLYTLIRQLDGVSLLIYCMRGRIKENAKANWNLFNRVICREKIPIIAIMTGLEGREDPDEWYDQSNKDSFRRNGINPRAVGCVVSVRGMYNKYQEVYEESRNKLHDLIQEHYLRQPWSEEKEMWFAVIYKTVYTARFAFGPTSRLEYSAPLRGLMDDFFRETEMVGEDAERLRAVLLNAEETWRKRKISKSVP